VTSTDGLHYRKGEPSDLRTTFELAEVCMHYTAHRMSLVGPQPPEADEIEREWQRRRDLIEFVAAQAGCYWVCEDEGETIGYARVCRFGEMEELTQLMVRPSHQGQGIARTLLKNCWPEPPTADLGRVVVAAGASADLSLYARFGVMPVTGHWHMRSRTDQYLEGRSHEIDAAEPAVVALEADRAVAEWKRLEPQAVGHRRPLLHEFFGRTRTCLATMEEGGERANALCWIDSEGDIGPAVGATPEDLVPVVLQALDRVARTREPKTFGVFCSTDSWWLLRRLRGLGFKVWWPSWIMCSIPLPGLDRYLPTKPAQLL